ncbi:putative enoyl-CoA hydratase 1 [Zhongshania aliphaticivorans]|uniref:Putative enoyl-CoA hydratase 1 n=1 Tax=Zhongshania aliphaticivorans TaxID=1470434 RepID=A0A5S9NRA3_9GAMM|nr:MaoC family dehydratase [Zhongshania aliphaticivorans]CAA0093047.1 putative enoyl-CoA hydratase 1 [Zhongshania aliphaticivorans]CAA0110786.1 putative enoyl-CoA hydratase 1 [Zhongshania aliphaticivorans]
MESVARESTRDIIGAQLESTNWFSVNQAQIDQFADCTLDHQFIHVDPEKAKETPFGSTVAHGFLSLSMLAYFAETFGVQIEGLYMGINYGFNKVRFISPVKVGSRIRCHAKVLDLVEKNPGQFMLTYDVEVEIEGDNKPALKAEWIMMQMVK